MPAGMGRTANCSAFLAGRRTCWSSACKVIKSRAKLLIWGWKLRLERRSERRRVKCVISLEEQSCEKPPFLCAFRRCAFVGVPCAGGELGAELVFFWVGSQRTDLVFSVRLGNKMQDPLVVLQRPSPVPSNFVNSLETVAVSGTMDFVEAMTADGDISRRTLVL